MIENLVKVVKQVSIKNTCFNVSQYTDKLFRRLFNTLFCGHFLNHFLHYFEGLECCLIFSLLPVKKIKLPCKSLEIVSQRKICQKSGLRLSQNFSQSKSKTFLSFKMPGNTFARLNFSRFFLPDFLYTKKVLDLV